MFEVFKIFKTKKKGIVAVTNTLILIIIALVLFGIVAYIVYQKIIQGRLNPIQ